MNKRIILLFSAVILLAFVAFAAAEVSETNRVYYGIIEDNGAVTTTATPVNGASLIGFVCVDSACNSVSSSLFGGAVLNSGSSNVIGITYPTTLQSNGYGLYFYKDGYIPYEVKANWAGTGSAPDAANYLTQKRTCALPVSNVVVNTNGNNVSASMTLTSPIGNAGPLSYIPASLSSQYSLNVHAMVNVTGSAGYSAMQDVLIPFSSSAPVNFQFTLPNGTYNVSLTAHVMDDVCLASPVSFASRNINITQSNPNPLDNTPPATISGLHTGTLTNNSIQWLWTNPSDSDFNSVIIYLDGTNVLNTSANSYIATGLQANSTHTITILTKDNSGNVNTTQVSNTTRTLANGVTPINPSEGSLFLTIVSPTATTYSSSGVLLSLSSNGSSVWYNINKGVNQTYTSPVTLNLANGNYTIYAYASNSTTTLSSNVSFQVSQGTHNDDHNDTKKKKSLATLVYGPIGENVTAPIIEDEPIVLAAKNPKMNWNWLLIILILATLVLIIILVIMTLMSRK